MASHRVVDKQSEHGKRVHCSDNKRERAIRLLGAMLGCAPLFLRFVDWPACHEPTAPAAKRGFTALSTGKRKGRGAGSFPPPSPTGLSFPLISSLKVELCRPPGTNSAQHENCYFPYSYLTVPAGLFPPLWANDRSCPRRGLPSFSGARKRCAGLCALGCRPGL